MNTLRMIQSFTGLRLMSGTSKHRSKQGLGWYLLHYGFRRHRSSWECSSKRQSSKHRSPNRENKTVLAKESMDESAKSQLCPIERNCYLNHPMLVLADVEIVPVCPLQYLACIFGKLCIACLKPKFYWESCILPCLSVLISHPLRANSVVMCVQEGQESILDT